MKHGADWYHRYPLSFLGGVQGLSARQHAVYSVALDLIYAHGGSVNNDPKWIAGWISDMGSAAVRKAIEQLVEMGKLEIDGDQITQKLAKNEAKTKEKLAENRAISGKKGGEKSAEIRAARKENKELAEASASSKNQPDKRREESSSSSSARASPSDDELLSDVMSAVGLNGGRIPTYWLPPGATIHVGRWRRDLGLSAEQIIATAKASRSQHEEPPGGPKALDRAMQNTANAVQAGPMKAAAPRSRQHATQQHKPHWKRMQEQQEREDRETAPLRQVG